MSSWLEKDVVLTSDPKRLAQAFWRKLAKLAAKYDAEIWSKRMQKFVENDWAIKRLIAHLLGQRFGENEIKRN